MEQEKQVVADGGVGAGNTDGANTGEKPKRRSLVSLEGFTVAFLIAPFVGIVVDYLACRLSSMGKYGCFPVFGMWLFAFCGPGFILCVILEIIKLARKKPPKSGVYVPTDAATTSAAQTSVAPEVAKSLGILAMVQALVATYYFMTALGAFAGNDIRDGVRFLLLSAPTIMYDLIVEIHFLRKKNSKAVTIFGTVAILGYLVALAISPMPLGLYDVLFPGLLNGAFVLVGMRLMWKG